MKVLLGSLTAAMLIGAVWAQPAEARCFWNGFTTVCSHPGWGWGGGWHRWHRWHRWGGGPWGWHGGGWSPGWRGSPGWGW